MERGILHLDFFIETITGFFNKFWFMFLFLLVLNVLDVVTGEIKAKYLKIESSRMATKGLYKKVFLWVLITITLGLSLIFLQIGKIFNVRIGFMAWLGRLVIIHAIINEFRSIIENIIQCDKSNIVPKWLKKGLEVTQETIDTGSDKLIDRLREILRNDDTREKIEKFLKENDLEVTKGKSQVKRRENNQENNYYNKENSHINNQDKINVVGDEEYRNNYNDYNPNWTNRNSYISSNSTTRRDNKGRNGSITYNKKKNGYRPQNERFKTNSNGRKKYYNNDIKTKRNYNYNNTYVNQNNYNGMKNYNNYNYNCRYDDF